MKVKMHASVTPSAHAHRKAEIVRFSGSVQRDSAPAAAFDVSIPAGEKSRIMLADGTALEFSVSALGRRRIAPGE